jgi:glycerophosphoryl diester phosphodiesterase
VRSTADSPKGRELIVLGHRGGRGEGWPRENSLAAFERALAEGADGVELDVRMSADEVPVLLHDPLLKDGRYVYRVKHAAMSGSPATLADALDVLAGRIVNVELKADVPSRRALARTAVATARRAKKTEIVFSSFDPFLVLACAALAPDIPRAILVGRRLDRIATALPLAMHATIAAVHLEDPLVTPARVARFRKLGLRTCAWTVNDVARGQALGEAGVEWLITDQPATFTSRRRT